MPTTLQKVEKSGQVAFCVCIGILYGIAYARLGCKIDDRIEFFLLEECMESFSVI